MKYVIAFLLIALLVRIDVVLRLLEQGVERLRRETAVINPSDFQRGNKPVGIPDDQAMRLTPRRRFLSMLETFRVNPETAVRLQAIDELKKQPLMFSKTSLDRDLEAAVFGWRDLIAMKEKELPFFLLDLSENLMGENKQMIQRFFTILMDNNLDLFLSTYVLGKDSNCMIATLVGENVPEEEKINILFDREKQLNEFVQREKVDPGEKKLADFCLLVLRLHLDKIAPPEPSGVDEAIPLEEGT